MTAKGQNIIDTTEVDATIASLTKLGRELMRRIGAGQFSFFDGGITEGSGIWSEVLGGEFADTCKNAGGVIGRLVKQDLLTRSETGEADGAWVDLTALGAAVAKRLAAEPSGKVVAISEAKTAKASKAKATKAPAKATPAKAKANPTAQAKALAELESAHAELLRAQELAEKAAAKRRVAVIKASAATVTFARMAEVTGLSTARMNRIAQEGR